MIIPQNIEEAVRILDEHIPKGNRRSKESIEIIDYLETLSDEDFAVFLYSLKPPTLSLGVVCLEDAKADTLAKRYNILAKNWTDDQRKVIKEKGKKLREQREKTASL